MSDVSQPMTRLSRRSLRERAAQMEAEAGTSTSPTPEASVEVAPEHGNSNALYDEATAARNQAISELDTAPTAAAPVSRVVRRSTTQMEPRRTQPPTPAVIQPGPVLHSDVAVAEVVTVSEVVEPVGPPVLPFAPVSSVVSEPNAPAVLLPGAPPWEAITTGVNPDTGETGVVQTEAKAGRHALRSAEAARVPPPSAGFTLVQYLILLAVAFVLGLLLWQLIVGEIPNPLDGVVHIGALIGVPGLGVPGSRKMAKTEIKS